MWLSAFSMAVMTVVLVMVCGMAGMLLLVRGLQCLKKSRMVLGMMISLVLVGSCLTLLCIPVDVVIRLRLVSSEIVPRGALCRESELLGQEVSRDEFGDGACAFGCELRGYCFV